MERIQHTNRRCQTSALADRITPRVITIFYHLRTIRVNQRNHIALQIVDIEVIDIVIGNHAGLPLRIIEEMQITAALRHVDNIFTTQRIVGRYAVDDLFNSQAVMVIGELCVGSVLHHAGQHTSGFPRKRPTVIGQRIANRIISNRLSANGRNLVLPVAVAIGFQVCLFSGFQFFKYMDKYRMIR